MTSLRKTSNAPSLLSLFFAFGHLFQDFQLDVHLRWLNCLFCFSRHSLLSRTIFFSRLFTLSLFHSHTIFHRTKKFVDDQLLFLLCQLVPYYTHNVFFCRCMRSPHTNASWLRQKCPKIADFSCRQSTAVRKHTVLHSTQFMVCCWCNVSTSSKSLLVRDTVATIWTGPKSIKYRRTTTTNCKDDKKSIAFRQHCLCHLKSSLRRLFKVPGCLFYRLHLFSSTLLLLSSCSSLYTLVMYFLYGHGVSFRRNTNYATNFLHITLQWPSSIQSVHKINLHPFRFGAFLEMRQIMWNKLIVYSVLFKSIPLLFASVLTFPCKTNFFRPKDMICPNNLHNLKAKLLHFYAFASTRVCHR